MFGTLPSPCGKGHATGATDLGVTNSTINIAYGDDRGFSGSPGLDQEMGDAVKAMIAWCNAQGGINGRKIVGDYYDAAVTNVGTSCPRRARQDFMLVGEGFALDGLAEQTRLGLQPGGRSRASPSPPSWPTPTRCTRRRRTRPTTARCRSPTRPRSSSAPRRSTSAMYGSTLSTQQQSTAKAVQAYTEAGWKFVNCPFQVNYNGEASYTPFVQKLQSCGAQIVFNDATPGPTLYGALEAENQIGYDPIWLLDAAEYTEGFAQWNTGGLGNNVYVRIVLRAARGGQGRPGGRPVPLDRQEVRRPDLGARRAVDLVVPPLGHRGQGVRLDPDPPVHDQPPRQGHELDRWGPQRAGRTRRRTFRRPAGSS